MKRNPNQPKTHTNPAQNSASSPARPALSSGPKPQPKIQPRALLLLSPARPVQAVRPSTPFRTPASPALAQLPTRSAQLAIRTRRVGPLVSRVSSGTQRMPALFLSLPESDSPAPPAVSPSTSRPRSPASPPGSLSRYPVPQSPPCFL